MMKTITDWKSPLCRFSSLVGVLLGLAGSLLSGCGEHHDRLSDIVGNPNGFLNREVQVNGEVTQVYELPLGITNLAAYRINDGTGQIWVISRIGAPVKGDRIGLKGRVREITKLNLPVVGNILGNVIDEEQRKGR